MLQLPCQKKPNPCPLNGRVGLWHLQPMLSSPGGWSAQEGLSMQQVA